MRIRNAGYLVPLNPSPEIDEPKCVSVPPVLGGEHGRSAAHIDAVVMRVQRGAVMTQLVAGDVDVVMEGAGRVGIREIPQSIRYDGIGGRTAQSTDIGNAAKRHISPAGEELRCVTLHFAHVGVPIVLELKQRVLFVEKIIRRIPHANERQHNAGIDVAQVDIANRCVQERHVLDDGIGVVEQLEQLVVGFNSKLNNARRWRECAELRRR